MNITRVLTLGDSLQYMLLISLMHFLGFPSMKNQLRKHKFQKFNSRATQTVDCGDGKSPISVTFHRINHAMPLRTPKSYLEKEGYGGVFVYLHERFGAGFRKKGREYFSCFGLDGPYPEDGICPWVHEYLSSDEPTLIWTGLGSHFHHMDAFQESMNYFVDLLDQHPRPNDIVWFRTQHPGHEACFSQSRRNETPYSSFQAYQENGVTSLYDWGLYRRHNMFMEEMVWKNRFRRNNTTPTMGMQDIY